MKNKQYLYYICACCLAIFGLSMLVLDIVKGQASAGIILIIPYVIGGGLYSFIGILSILGALFIFFIGFFKSDRFESIDFDDLNENDIQNKSVSDRKKGVKGTKNFGGVILIGPFPIVFGSGGKIILYIVIITIILTIITFISLFLLLHFW